MNSFVNLATVDDVQEYLTIPTDKRAASKDEVAKFLRGASADLIRAINRYPVLQPYTETRDGTGGARMLCANGPVRQVNQVKIGGIAISPSPNGVSLGYIFDRISIAYLMGCFPRGMANVFFDYYAGWIPATAAAWAGNKSYNLFDFVLDSGGNVQQVTVAGTSGPTAPTWATTPGATTTDGTVAWTLVLPDNESVLLWRAAVTLTAQRWRRRPHLDESSYSMGGQITASFSAKDVPPEVQTAIDQCHWVVPIPR